MKIGLHSISEPLASQWPNGTLGWDRKIESFFLQLDSDGIHSDYWFGNQFRELLTIDELLAVVSFILTRDTGILFGSEQLLPEAWKLELEKKIRAHFLLEYQAEGDQILSDLVGPRRELLQEIGIDEPYIESRRFSFAD